MFIAVFHVVHIIFDENVSKLSFTDYFEWFAIYTALRG